LHYVPVKDQNPVVRGKNNKDGLFDCF
jgi:hypothetical protein